MLHTPPEEQQQQQQQLKATCNNMMTMRMEEEKEEDALCRKGWEGGEGGGEGGRDIFRPSFRERRLDYATCAKLRFDRQHLEVPKKNPGRKTLPISYK